MRSFDKDEILGKLGLESRPSTAAAIASTLGSFGVGLLVGAGVALLLAPKSGKAMRDDLRERVNDGISSIRDKASTKGGFSSESTSL